MITIAVSSMFIHNMVFFIYIYHIFQVIHRMGLLQCPFFSSEFFGKEKPEKPEKARRDSHVPRRGGCFP